MLHNNHNIPEVNELTDRVNNKQRKFRCFQNQSVIALYMQGWIVTPHALAKDIKGLSKNATCRKRQQNRNFMEKKWQTVDIIMNQTEIACSQMS